MVNWRLVELDNEIFLVLGYWVFQKNIFFNENQLVFSLVFSYDLMYYHSFLHYRWFLQNLVKESIRTNMHMTVYIILLQVLVFLCLVVSRLLLYQLPATSSPPNTSACPNPTSWVFKQFSRRLFSWQSMIVG
jgi:hypothetical protein